MSALSISLPSSIALEYVVSVIHFLWCQSSTVRYEHCFVVDQFNGIREHMDHFTRVPVILWHGKEPNTKTNQHKSLFISTLLFHIHSMSNIEQKFVSLFLFLGFIIYFPTCKNIQSYLWFYVLLLLSLKFVCTNFFHCSVVGGVHHRSSLQVRRVSRMVFIGYLNTRVEINKKYDAKNGIR